MEIGVKQLCSRWGLAFSYQWEDAVYCGLHGVQLGIMVIGGGYLKRLVTKKYPIIAPIIKTIPIQINIISLSLLSIP